MMGPGPLCYIQKFMEIGRLVPEDIFEGFLPYMGVAAILVMLPSVKSDEKDQSLPERCIASQSRFLNGRNLGDTIGKCTSFQYNVATV